MRYAKHDLLNIIDMMSKDMKKIIEYASYDTVVTKVWKDNTLKCLSASTPKGLGCQALAIKHFKS